jgi:hypothetical protein
MAQIIKKKIHGEEKIFKIAKNKLDNKYWVYYLNTFMMPCWMFMQSFNTPKEARKYVSGIEKEFNIIIGGKLNETRAFKRKDRKFKDSIKKGNQKQQGLC